ncbi:MAG: hypothetical protein KGD59_08030 [Candidatus Heimdallarchaeota archaeon]|nr:hypothetical protein [Candidatus Heimdallarchaeota archaeon]MBY8994485.1 hypothetical protein [Candidatus Heimdallarchaeota archaeon]
MTRKEERYKANRILLIMLMIFGVVVILVGFGVFATEEEWNAVLVISLAGLGFGLIGLVGFLLNRYYYRLSLRQVGKIYRVDLRLSDLEIERMVEGSGVLDLEQFEKERSIEFDFKYILVLDLPKKAICMISKTQIEVNETVLQCPECQNYYLSKYLLGWLNKNSNCPICQTALKLKKT